MHTLTVYCTIKNMLFDFFISGSNAYFHFRIREVSFKINNLHISLWKKSNKHVILCIILCYVWYSNNNFGIFLFVFTQLKTKYRFMLLRNIFNVRNNNYSSKCKLFPAVYSTHSRIYFKCNRLVSIPINRCTTQFSNVFDTHSKTLFSLGST